MHKRKHENNEKNNSVEPYKKKVEEDIKPFLLKVSEKKDDIFEDSGNYEEKIEKDKEDKRNGFIKLQLVMLKELLFDVERCGDESTCGEATELPAYVDIFIKQFGLVPLPLNETVAERLISVIRLPSDATIVTKDMDASFEIDPSLIEIRNQRWNEGLVKLVKRVGNELGFQGEIEAKFYKMLLDKKGAFYKKHINVEKDADTVATLIIQLPSNCEGGEIIVHAKDGSKQSYDFGQATSKSACAPHFLAHYVNIEHEVHQVKSGYRLALVYTLRWLDSTTSCVYHKTDNLNKMTKCLDELNNFSYQIGIILNSTYSVRKGAKVFDGVDKIRYQFLEKANANLPSEKQFSIYIAKAKLVVEYCNKESGKEIEKQTYTESVDSKHEGYNEKDKELYIEKLRDVDGFVYGNIGNLEDLSFLKRIINLYSSSPFVDLNDEKNWGKTREVEVLGYRSHEEGYFIHLNYQRDLLLIWPKYDNFDIFLKIGEEYAIDFLYKSLITNRTIFAADVETLITQLKTKNKILNEDFTRKMMLVFMKVVNILLVSVFLSEIQFEYPVVEMAKLIITYKWKIIKDYLANALLPVTIETVSKNCALVKELYHLNDPKTAYECLVFAVLPVLDDVWKFSETEDYEMRHHEYTVRDIVKRRSLILFTLADTLLLFKHEDISEPTEKYVRLVAQMVTEKDQDILSELLRSFLKEPGEYCRHEFIIKLFEIRYKWLDFKLSMSKEFRWSMSGTISGHMELDTFLRSEDTQITYYDSFQDLNDASRFAFYKGGCRYGYSLNITANEYDEKPCVLIEKTREFYEIEMKKLKEYETEAQTLKTILNLNKES